MKHKWLYGYLIDLTWTQYILQYQIHSVVFLTSLLVDWFQSISFEITFIFPKLVCRHTCSSLGAHIFNNIINLLVIFGSFSSVNFLFLWHLCLAQRRKYRSMEQNRKPRDNSTNLWTPYLRQRRQGYTMEKRQPL